jgi:MoaA/NifB/PqqE/SkfB family radical SAM enzyme
MKSDMDTTTERIGPSAPAAGLLRRATDAAGPLLKLGARRMVRAKSPFQMTLSLTNRCNFRCTYCDIPLQHRDEMDTAGWMAAIDELRAGGMGRASLIGGEPLLRKDVGAIIRHLKRRGIHASMNTNGWLVPDRIDDVAALDLVCVSIDGPEAVHDRQRHRGSYARVIRALDALRQRTVPVVTMTVITPESIDTVEHILELARAYGHRAYFHLEHDKAMDVLQPIAPALSQERVAELARHLRDLKRRGEPVGNSYEALERQATSRYLITCDTCLAGSYYGYVFSDGTVSHCIFTQAQVERGNGRARGFVRAFQELAPPTGPGCSCVPLHEVNRMLHFDVRVLYGALDVALKSALR